VLAVYECVLETFAPLLGADVWTTQLCNRAQSTNGTLICQNPNSANLPVCDTTANKSGMKGFVIPNRLAGLELERLSQLLQETEHFCRWRQEKVAKIVPYAPPLEWRSLEEFPAPFFFVLVRANTSKGWRKGRG
jgi:hypothetical protein